VIDVVALLLFTVGVIVTVIGVIMSRKERKKKEANQNL
jgi:hypothetical protein